MRAVAPLGVAAGAVRVRTFHALGREILRDAGVAVEPLADRAAVLAEVAPWADEADLAPARHRDLAAQGRARRDGRRRRGRSRRRPGRPRVRRLRGGRRGERRARLRRPHPARDRRAGARPGACSRAGAGAVGELLVDEVQDVDRAQLRLALLLAAPANRIFLVGDDDQSIYGWRLADVRRILGLEALLPGLRRVDLRGQLPLPAPGRRARRPARRAQRGAVRQGDPGRAGGDRAAGPRAGPVGRDRSASSAPCGRGRTTGRHGRSSPGRTASCCPAVVVALGLGLPFRAPRIELLARLTAGRRAARHVPPSGAAAGEPLADRPRARPGRVRRRPATQRRVATALLGWAVGHPIWPRFIDGHRARRARGSPTCAATTRR